MTPTATQFDELDRAKHDGERRATLARVMMIAALVSTIVNILGSLAFWFALPERLRSITATQLDQGLKISAVDAKEEIQASKIASQEATMARIDERTKAIQDDVRQIHADFSFRSNSTPTLK